LFLSSEEKLLSTHRVSMVAKIYIKRRILLNCFAYDSTLSAGVENLADISEPQLPPNEKNINEFNFPSVYSVSME